ncbi:MAG: hypothetical protein ACRDBG_08855, partial [Waterburya sp.]
YDTEKGEDIQRSAGYKIDSGNVVQIQERVEKDVQETAKTNKQLRAKQFLMLSRKLKPYVSDALATINELVDVDTTDPRVKYNASKFLIQMSKSLTENIYQDKYDDEEGEEIEKEIAPIFSLKMINNNTENKDA